MRVRGTDGANPRKRLGAVGISIVLVAALMTPLAGAQNLPGGRGYELVTPQQSRGIDIVGDPSNTRVARDGSAIAFASLGAFQDAVGTGIIVNYVAQRTGTKGTHGWESHAITPAQDPATFPIAFAGTNPLYVGDFSPDLSKAVFRAWSPVTEAPNVAFTRNLYMRDDVLRPGPGSYTLLTDSPSLVPASESSISYRPALVGASDDFEHVVFESVLRLTDDAPLCMDGSDPVYGCAPLLYEWEGGTLRLVGVLPDGSIAPSAIAGRGALQRRYTQHTVSNDGSRIFFTSPATVTGTGPLYMRQAGEESVHLNASERTDCADGAPCSGAPAPDPVGPLPASFGDATPDGRLAFFTSDEQLTDDDANANADLYRYDPDAMEGERLTRLSVDGELSDGDSAPVRGLIGTSTDGSYVYFIADGYRVSGVDEGPSPRIYLWHDGVLRDIGGFADGGDMEGNRYPNSYQNSFKVSRVSPSGRFMAFIAHAGDGLTGYDHGQCGTTGCGEVYVYDAGTGAPVDGKLTCASCPASGATATSEANNSLRVNQSALGRGSHLAQSLTDDGRVFFSTGERLVPQDANGSVRDVYEYDANDGSVQLVSSGKSEAHSFFAEASPDGRDVFFLTREQLVGWDRNQSYDLYDARMGGGFPEPSPEPAACIGDACQGPVRVPVPERAPGSATLIAPGDASPIGVFHVYPVSQRQLTRWTVKDPVVVRVRVSEAGTLTARLRGRIKGAARTLALTRQEVERGGVVQLRLRLSPRGRRAVREAQPRRLAIAVAYSEAAGAVQRVRLALGTSRAPNGEKR